MVRKVFYSFHFDNDYWRVNQIRNIGVIEDNKPVIANKWEEIKKNGNTAIKKWIDDNIRDKSCLIVLIGSETANRKWVKYEIKKAWEDGKGVLGIYIHMLKDQYKSICNKGKNPFEEFILNNIKLSNIVKTYDPSSSTSTSTYKNIENNIEKWIEDAIKIRKNI